MPCDELTVLHDHQTGWPGQCLGLKQLNMTDNKTCAETCTSDPECTVWQINTKTGCWLGGAGLAKGAIATECNDRAHAADAFSSDLTGAQRIQHGKVKVVQVMNATWVDGLFPMGLGDLNGTVGVERCRSACYSDIHCNFWQYGKGGCQVETSANKAANPPVLHNGTADAKALVAGEIIEHYCEAHHPVKKSNFWMIFGIVAGILALCCLLGIVAALLNKPKETKPKRTRAVKLAQPKAPEKKPLMALPPPVPVPVPSVQVVQAVPSYTVVPQAAPVAVAAPRVVATSIVAERPVAGSVLIR